MLRFLPTVFSGVEVHSISVGVIGATLTQIKLSPGYVVPGDVVALDRLLERVGGMPMGPGPYRAWDVGSTRVGRVHTGWTDTFVWARGGGEAVWMLTEHVDPHQDEWEPFVNTLVARAS